MQTLAKAVIVLTCLLGASAPASAKDPSPVGKWKAVDDSGTFTFRVNGKGSYTSIFGNQMFVWRLHRDGGGEFDGRMVYITYDDELLEGQVGLLVSRNSLLVKRGTGIPIPYNSTRYVRQP